MPFFLLGKTPDEKLELLSQEVFASRADALAALSAITSSPEFTGWDSDVMVANIEQATPVLLVRPQAQPVDPELDVCNPGPEAPEVFIEEVIAEELVIDEPEAEPVAEQPVFEPEPVVAEVEPEPVVVVEVPEPTPEPVVEPEPEDAFVVQSDPEPVDPAYAEAVMTQVEEDDLEVQSLKDALLRTTTQMEAAGVVAAASITAEGVAEPASVYAGAEATVPEAPSQTVDPLSAPVPVWPWDVDAEDADAATDEAEADSTAEEPAQEPAQEPADDIVVPLELEDEPEAPAAPNPFDLDAFEDETSDDAPLIRVTSDDESNGRPVILGAYDAAPEAPVVEAAAGPEAAAFESAAPPAQDAPPAVPSSDFILDLDSAPAPDAPAGYEPTEASLDGLTCDECIYTDTCPNRGERTPADCGSFQWK